MNRFSIGDIESLTGIKSHTIRIWEQRYDLVTPKRTETNIRFYDDKDLCTFLNISTLNENGFKISEIAKMTETELGEKVASISDLLNTSCFQVNSMSAAMLSLNEKQFDQILNYNIKKLGIENTVLEVIFPFMRKIGVMWQTSKINSAHEHFVTHLIKQKLICAIDKLPTPNSEIGKRFLLFLPEGETHELGLLFANYLIKARGHQVLYLGQNLPCEDLYKVSSFYNPHFVLSVLTSVLIENDVNNLIKRIVDKLPNWPLLLTGPLILQNEINPIEGLTIIQSVGDLTEMLEKETNLEIVSV